MEPRIGETQFGSITIAGESYEYDVFIRLNGKVEKRNKKLSQEITGTSHIVSLVEAAFIYEEGAEQIVIGSGQSGLLKLSDEANGFFKQKKCHVVLLPTPEAIQYWNTTSGTGLGLFHVTC